MRLVLTITATSLLLAGCAGDYDKLADGKVCARSMSPTRAVASELFPSISLNIPSRNLLGAGRLDNDDTMTYACVDPASNKTNAPEGPNPHKIRLDHLSDAI